MKKIADHIMFLDEDINIKEFEEIGYEIYTLPDGITHYAVHKDAPAEAHHLASGAAQGDPDLIDQI